MKKPEQYIEQFYKNESLNSKVIYDFIKQIQVDTIDETVKLCAENVQLGYYEFKEDWMEEPFNMVSDDLGNIHAINKQSILKCAEILKQQL